jgi:hypothetical protein
MVGVDSYMMSGAETDSESTRLRNIQQASDSFTIKHLEATGRKGTSGCSNLPAQQSRRGRRSSGATCSPAGQPRTSSTCI